jgi:hypothetical protein
MWRSWADDIWFWMSSWVRDRVMTPCHCPHHLATYKGKIRTRGPRHSWEVYSWQLPPGTMSWHWIVCNHQPVTLPVPAQSACESPGMRWGLWMCRFQLDNLRDPKCIPAPQVLNRLPCLLCVQRAIPLHKDVIGCVYASGLQCWGGCFSKQVLQSVTALLGDKGWP